MPMVSTVAGNDTPECRTSRRIGRICQNTRDMFYNTAVVKDTLLEEVNEKYNRQ